MRQAEPDFLGVLLGKMRRVQEQALAQRNSRNILPLLDHVLRGRKRRSLDLGRRRIMTPGPGWKRSVPVVADARTVARALRRSRSWSHMGAPSSQGLKQNIRDIGAKVSWQVPQSRAVNDFSGKGFHHHICH